MIDLNFYKTKLEEEKKKVLEELSAMGTRDIKTGDWQAMPYEETSPEADENDLADRAEDFEERTSMLNTLASVLLEIDSALGRIEAGSFGKCIECKKDIHKDRLNANPSSAKCAECIKI